MSLPINAQINVMKIKIGEKIFVGVLFSIIVIKVEG